MTFSDQISVLGYNENSADPVKMPQHAASDHGLHCLLTEISMENAEKKMKISTNLKLPRLNDKDGQFQAKKK